MEAATRCSCGFERLDDGEVFDHLVAMFEPEGNQGNDGQLHEEWAGLMCCCGFTAGSDAELDAHFLAAFTPAGSIGSDGHKHEPIP